MSMTIGFRFRPVDANGNASADARRAARERWTDALNHWPGVRSFDFRLPDRDPPVERLEVRTTATTIPPVDMMIVFETGNHADTLFGNSELVANLMGVVVGPHAIHTVGQQQFNGTALEIPH